MDARREEGESPAPLRSCKSGRWSSDPACPSRLKRETVMKHFTCECGEHAFRMATKRVVYVSPQDAKWLDRALWVRLRQRADGTARSVVNVSLNRRHRTVLARAILGVDKLVDHQDGDGCNNRRGNLRPSSVAQNTRNRRCVQGIIPFKGVTFERHKSKYRASIELLGKRVSLGLFLTPENAAYAYDQGARAHFGEFAATNADLGLLPKDYQPTELRRPPGRPARARQIIRSQEP